MNRPVNVDEYIKQYDGIVRERLEVLRKLVKDLAIGSEEKISYGMPAYKVDGKILIYFMAHTNHIGVYPGRVENYGFMPELLKYKSGKSTLKFPNNQEIPYDQIKRYIESRIKQI